MNKKRIQRLWRLEGLKVPYRERKKPLRGVGVHTGAMSPLCPNAIWALDFQFDETREGRQLKLLRFEIFSTSTLCRISVQVSMLLCTLLPFCWLSRASLSTGLSGVAVFGQRFRWAVLLFSTSVHKLKSLILDDLSTSEDKRESEVKRLRSKVTELRHARQIIADRTMDGSLPIDIAKTKQADLGDKLAKAETDLERHQSFSDRARVQIERFFDAAANAAVSYERSSPDLRREWNYSRYDSLEIDVEDYDNLIVRGREKPIFQALRNAKIPARLKSSSRARLPVRSTVNGSRVELLVEVTRLCSNPLAPLFIR